MVTSLVVGQRKLQQLHMGSVIVAHGLDCPVARGILVHRSGTEPVLPTLAGGFSTTGPPGKSLPCLFVVCYTIDII